MTTPFQVPPHDQGAEEAVVAACMVPDGWAFIPEITATVSTKDFWFANARLAFASICRLTEQGSEPNPITVAFDLSGRGELEETGGQSFLHEWVRDLSTPIGAVWYAGLVRECSLARDVIQAASQVLQMAYDTPGEWRSAVELGIDRLLSVGGEAVGSRSRTAHEILVEDRLLDSIEAHMEDPTMLSGLPTGFPLLDLMLDGWQPGTVTLISAETSIGKSAFTQDRMNWLVSSKYAVGVFTTEMGRKSWLRRVVYQQAELDRQALRKRTAGYSSGERSAVRDAMDKLDTDLLSICDIGAPSVAQIKTEARRWRAKGMLDALAIDHIDMVGQKGGGRTAELEAATAELHSLATDLEIPILVVSHMSRPGQSNTGSKLHRLKNSGSKEQDADVVMFLEPVNREGDILDPDQARATVAQQQWVSVDLDVQKNRDGNVGKIRLIQDWRRGGRFFEQEYR